MKGKKRKNVKEKPAAAASMEKALREMLDRKRLDSITVMMICERADVNRQSFYYHYSNIADMVIKTYGSELMHNVEKCDTYLTWVEGFETILKFWQDNRNAILHSHGSAYWPEIEGALIEWGRSVISRAIDQCASDHEIPIRSSDAELMTELYLSAFVGILKWYSRNGMKDSPGSVAEKCEAVLRNSIEQSCRAFFEERSGL